MQDWTISYGPITIGDAESLPAVNYSNFDILSMPEIRTNDLALIQRDGLWAGDDYLGGRTVNLSLEVQGNSPEEFSSAVNLIQRAFSPGVDGETPLSFQIPGLCNGRSAYVKVRTRKRSAPLDASFARLRCAFEIELYATDPVIYASAPTSINLHQGIPALVRVEGSRPAKITGASPRLPNAKLTNALTGEVQQFTGSTFAFEYAPGDHYVILSGTGTPIDPTGFAYLSWTDSWV